MEFSNKNYYSKAGYFSLILFLLVFVGFFKTYFGIFPQFKASIQNAEVIHFHAVVSTVWVILLIVQPMLIHYKKFKIHKLVGKVTYVLVPLIIFSFITLMFTKYHEAKMNEWPLFDVILNFYFQVLHTLFFIIFYSLAIINKRNTALHAGYMIATGLIFVNPSVKRVFMNGFGLSFTISETIAIAVTDLLVIALLLLAKRNNLNYKLYIIILVMFLFYHLPMLSIMYYFFPEA